MKQKIFGLAILVAIIYSGLQIRSCNNNFKDSPSSLDVSKSYDLGYEAGYNKAKQEFQNSGYDTGYEDARIEYQRRINNLARDYDTKVKDEYKKGFTDGEVSMREQITAKIELDARNKARQGDWNAILFDFKD
jgi:uncharacterized membrane protein YkoI